MDTGFIVYNERTYPRFVGLLAELGVETMPSDMSFGSACDACGIAYSSRGLAASFRRLACSPVPPSGRCLRTSPASIGTLARSSTRRTASRATLGEWLDERGYGRGFRDHFLVPITSAVWSTAAERVHEFPIDYLLRFLDNHGLIGYGNSPQWRVVRGGSQAYVERLVAALPVGAVRTGSPVTEVQRDPLGVTVHTGAAERYRFDAVVIATHADDALRLLADPDDRERRTLGGFEYSRNQVVLHTDETVLPRSREGPGVLERPHAGLPVAGRCAHDDLPHEPAAVDPRAGAVQRSLNPGDKIARERVILERAFSHPHVYVRDAREPRTGSVPSRVAGGPGSPGRISATASTRTAAAQASRRPR